MSTQFEALIVDPDPESRMRLRQATSVCGEFTSVKLESSLLEALKMMRDRMTCNVIFISQTFESDQSREFVKMARETPYGQYAAYIMVLNGSQQNRSGVATNVTGGVDGFLFQPYSVEALRETTAIAAEVRAKATTARKVASRKLLADAIVPQVEKLFGLELVGKPSPQQKYELKAVVRSLRDAYEDERDFANALADLFMAVPPPKPPSEDDLSPIARRRRLRLQEAKRREEEAALKGEDTPGKKKGQGGYFVRRK